MMSHTEIDCNHAIWKNARRGFEAMDEASHAASGSNYPDDDLEHLEELDAEQRMQDSVHYQMVALIHDDESWERMMDDYEKGMSEVVE